MGLCATSFTCSPLFTYIHWIVSRGESSGDNNETKFGFKVETSIRLFVLLARHSLKVLSEELHSTHSKTLQVQLQFAREDSLALRHELMTESLNDFVNKWRLSGIFHKNFYYLHPRQQADYIVVYSGYSVDRFAHESRRLNLDFISVFQFLRNSRFEYLIRCLVDSVAWRMMSLYLMLT